ncbi:MAG: hypothetical protein QS721_09480 [Candidatus Endonucleobacter sp. (ex Gigantidas childressi)]|nr:hypothetical protein [Candidatus Endonucleobacter sp. (ex Gigantidas childressi)]
MKEQDKVEYQETDAMMVDLTEVRFKRLRESYLDGQIKVDSKKLAEKLLAFEWQLSAAMDEHDKINRKTNK